MKFCPMPECHDPAGQTPLLDSLDEKQVSASRSVRCQLAAQQQRGDQHGTVATDDQQASSSCSAVTSVQDGTRRERRRASRP
jgi:hypothetical protein